MNQLTSKLSFLTVLLAPALLWAGAPFAHAQVYSTYGTTVYPTSTYSTQIYTTPTYSTPSTSSCIELTAPMTIGDSDYLNGGQVSELQTFLVRDGFLSSAYITGYYGSLTASAVAQFQASRGISPVGVVGPITRAAIEQVSCDNSGVNYVSPAHPIYPTNPSYPTYPINPGGPIQYGYGELDLNSLSASNEGSSIVITLQGYGFDETNNTVNFGTQSISGISSNGSELSFTVPSVPAGSYNISVTTSHGTTNSLSYYVSNENNDCYQSSNNYQCNNCEYPNTEYNESYDSTYNSENCGTSYNQSITITSVSGSGSVGATATIYGTGFTTNDNTVYFGNQTISDVYSSNGTSLTFTIPNVTYNNSGAYSLYVVNGNGSTSNTIQFTVNGGSYTNGQLTISYLSPTEGNVGTQIAIQGTGFSQYDNTVHFGNGGSLNLSSYNNGDTIYYNVPSTVSGCDLTTNGGVCAQYIQEVTAGSYPIYVTNENGQSSNTEYFQVY